MRKERIASVLEREISQIVAQEMNDPRLGFITITKVLVTADLKEAVVYFSSLEKKPEVHEILKRAKGYIRSILAQRVRIKFIPDLRFEVDDSFEYGKKIDTIIGQANKPDKE